MWEAQGKRLGLDKPLHIQYLSWLSSLVLRVESLDDFERGALLADGVLDELNEESRAELAALEGEARKTLFLKYFSPLRPDRVEDLSTSLFWQSRVFAMAENYQYSGSGLELMRGDEWRVVTLDFGRSFKDQQPVIDRILERLPITLEINLIGLIIAYVVGVPLGVLISVKHNGLVDRLATTGTFMLYSMPWFWVGMLLFVFFCFI